MFGSSAPQSNSRRCHIAVVVLEEAVPHLSVKKCCIFYFWEMVIKGCFSGVIGKNGMGTTSSSACSSWVMTLQRD